MKENYFFDLRVLLYVINYFSRINDNLQLMKNIQNRNTTTKALAGAVAALSVAFVVLLVVHLNSVGEREAEEGHQVRKRHFPKKKVVIKKTKFLGGKW